MFFFKKRVYKNSIYVDYLRLILTKFFPDGFYTPERYFRIRVKFGSVKSTEPGALFKIVNIYSDSDGSVKADLAGTGFDDSHVYGFCLEKLDEDEIKRIFVKITSEIYLNNSKNRESEDRVFLRELLAGA